MYRSFRDVSMIDTMMILKFIVTQIVKRYFFSNWISGEINRILRSGQLSPIVTIDFLNADCNVLAASIDDISHFSPQHFTS